MMPKTVIIEDEPEHAEHLRRLAVKHSELKPISVCQSGSEALNFLSQQNPKVVLLDIDLGDMTAFELLDQLPNRSFYLIFTTVYNEFALNAFKVHAVDYLLKPIKENEFDAAIRHMFSEPLNDKKFQALMAEFRKLSSRFLIINEKNHIKYIPVHDILYLAASRSYCEIHVLEDNYVNKILVSGNLKNYEQNTELQEFMRIHQSYLINPEYIREFDKKTNKLKLVQEIVLPVARGKRGILS